MSSSQRHSQVVPARLSFIAIYNPELGPTDETFPDQVVFWYSRAAYEARIAAIKSTRNDRARGDAIREEENEKLRQIGFAQGIVDFARTFSNEQPVESVDTEKSRIVLHELEKGWWVLASIDLTRLPATSNTAASENTPKGAVKTESRHAVEYSSREVSPSILLKEQLLQAHYIFTLHHGPSLTELFVKLPREKFCNTLDRFWNRFARSWDVLLHGNPAVDAFSGVKLSSGGELGMGVGEEEWGSGERDVLEDLTRGTEGLVDTVVSRFGQLQDSNDTQEYSGVDELHWMGSGSFPQASDGVIFGGINAIARPSLRNVSLWMRSIYTYGDHAYGVRDHPSRERRKRRRRKSPQPEPEPGWADEPVVKASSTTSAEDWQRNSPTGPFARGKEPKSTNVKQSKSEERNAKLSTERPKIPPPIATAVERSLDKAVKDASTDHQPTRTADPERGTTLGIPDQYMKYLTFGLSTLGQSSTANRPEASRRTSTASSVTIRAPRQPSTAGYSADDASESESAHVVLNQVDPIPDGAALRAKVESQKRLEAKGHFLIGLKGDLENVLTDGEDSEAGKDGSEGSRLLLRTLHIEVCKQTRPDESDENISPSRSESNDMNTTFDSANPPDQNFRRLQVVVYVRRPFIYCFLFEGRTPALALARFYRELHQSLEPIHKPLLSSTSAAKIAQRIEEAQMSAKTSDAASIQSSSKAIKSEEPAPIYDLIYDPRLLTVHTSIPNIPEPGTPAAEGISMFSTKKVAPSSWTRVESLNVHSQILTTLAGVKDNSNEFERTSKTSRGWWVVWMKLSPSAPAEEPPDTTPFVPPALRLQTSDDSDATLPGPPSITPATEKSVPPNHRMAFLVRKASEPHSSAASRSTSTTSRAASSMWNALSMRSTTLADETTGGVRAGWGPGALSTGIGFDARQYVDGLLSLNR